MKTREISNTSRDDNLCLERRALQVIPVSRTEPLNDTTRRDKNLYYQHRNLAHLHYTNFKRNNSIQSEENDCMMRKIERDPKDMVIKITRSKNKKFNNKDTLKNVRFRRIYYNDQEGALQPKKEELLWHILFIV